MGASVGEMQEIRERFRFLEETVTRLVDVASKEQAAHDETRKVLNDLITRHKEIALQVEEIAHALAVQSEKAEARKQHVSTLTGRVLKLEQRKKEQ